MRFGVVVVTNLNIYFTVAGLFALGYTYYYYRYKTPDNYGKLSAGSKRALWLFTLGFTSLIAPLLLLEIILKPIIKITKRGAKA